MEKYYNKELIRAIRNQEVKEVLTQLIEEPQENGMDVKNLLNEMLELGCEMCCNNEGYVYYYGNGGYITSNIAEYESDKELNNLCIARHDNETNTTTIYKGNIKHILKEIELNNKTDIEKENAVSKMTTILKLQNIDINSDRDMELCRYDNQEVEQIWTDHTSVEIRTQDGSEFTVSENDLMIVKDFDATVDRARSLVKEHVFTNVTQIVTDLNEIYDTESSLNFQMWRRVKSVLLENFDNYYIDNSHEIEELKSKVKDLRQIQNKLNEVVLKLGDEQEDILNWERDKMEIIGDKIEVLMKDIQKLEKSSYASISEVCQVSEWLYRKLLSHGEVVTKSEYGYLWGMKTFDMLHMERVILQIAEDELQAYNN